MNNNNISNINDNNNLILTKDNPNYNLLANLKFIQNQRKTYAEGDDKVLSENFSFTNNYIYSNLNITYLYTYTLLLILLLGILLFFYFISK